MKYRVFAKGELVGESEFEHGDPPMGVIFGIMKPTDHYWKYKSIFESQDFEAIERLELQAVTNTGQVLEPCAGVGIEDASAEVGEQCIEVTILGLDSTVYEQCFSHHMRTYEAKYE